MTDARAFTETVRSVPYTGPSLRVDPEWRLPRARPHAFDASASAERAADRTTRLLCGGYDHLVRFVSEGSRAMASAGTEASTRSGRLGRMLSTHLATLREAARQGIVEAVRHVGILGERMASDLRADLRRGTSLSVLPKPAAVFSASTRLDAIAAFSVRGASIAAGRERFRGFEVSQARVGRVAETPPVVPGDMPTADISIAAPRLRRAAGLLASAVVESIRAGMRGMVRASSKLEKFVEAGSRGLRPAAGRILDAAHREAEHLRAAAGHAFSPSRSTALALAIGAVVGMAASVPFADFMEGPKPVVGTHAPGSVRVDVGRLSTGTSVVEPVGKSPEVSMSTSVSFGTEASMSAYGSAVLDAGAGLAGTAWGADAIRTATLHASGEPTPSGGLRAAPVRAFSIRHPVLSGSGMGTASRVALHAAVSGVDGVRRDDVRAVSERMASTADACVRAVGPGGTCVVSVSDSDGAAASLDAVTGMVRRTAAGDASEVPDFGGTGPSIR